MQMSACLGTAAGIVNAPQSSQALKGSPAPAHVQPHGPQHMQPLRCGRLGQGLPMSTRVFLLKAGSLTTSS